MRKEHVKELIKASEWSQVVGFMCTWVQAHIGNFVIKLNYCKVLERI